MFTENQHISSLFQPATQIDRDQFDARIRIIGRRLESHIRSRLWYLCSDPADMDDAVQGALIALWKAYQRQPWIMDMGDGWWMKIGQRAARWTLRNLIAQHGLKTANGVRRLEHSQTSLADSGSGFDALELAEIRHFHHEHRSLHRESDQIDRQIDTERLIHDALLQLTPRQQEALRRILPLIPLGYPLVEAARTVGIERARAQYAWHAFQKVCVKLSGQSCGQMKGKGTPASAAELEQIRTLAELGLSCSVIAERIGRNKQFVTMHFARATGYRRGANNQRNPLTPERVEQMKQLRTQGLSMAAIARQVGCSAGSVCHWLNQ